MPPPFWGFAGRSENRPSRLFSIGLYCRVLLLCRSLVVYYRVGHFRVNNLTVCSGDFTAITGGLVSVGAVCTKIRLGKHGKFARVVTPCPGTVCAAEIYILISACGTVLPLVCEGSCPADRFHVKICSCGSVNNVIQTCVEKDTCRLICNNRSVYASVKPAGSVTTVFPVASVIRQQNWKSSPGRSLAKGTIRRDVVNPVAHPPGVSLIS